MNRIKTLCRISNWVLAGATVLAGTCLIVGCLIIYNSGGEQIYTPEKVAQTFAAIAVPVWLWAVLAILAAALHMLCPQDRKQPFESQPEMTLQRLYSRVDLSRCPQALQDNLLKLRQQRRQDAQKALLLLLGCSALFLLYGANPNNYDSTKISTSVITSLVLLVLAMIFPLVSMLDAAHRARISMRIEAELLKGAPKEARITPPAPKKQLWILPVRAILLCAALGLILYGFFAGGTADVLTKAVNICTECVGLG